MPLSRRQLFRTAAGGLAAVGTATLTLRADAAPTEPSGDLGDYTHFLAQNGVADSPTAAAEKNWAPTEDNILGPYYRAGAPFRGKITPPLAEGNVLVISGRVWGFDTKKPLAGATLDIWQADHAGRYDNDDPDKPPAKGVFVNRARLITDDNGYYEYETIHPGPYKIGPNAWRPSHIHYLVQAAGYKKLVTQLYFKGDKHNETDQFIKPSLIIEPTFVQTGVEKNWEKRSAPPKIGYSQGTFDIVLAKA